MSERRPWRPTVRSSPSGMMCSSCGTPPSMTTSLTRGCPGRRSGPRTSSSTMQPGTVSRAGRWGPSSRSESVSVCSIVSLCPLLLFPDWFNLLLTQIIKTISILVRAGPGQPPAQMSAGAGPGCRIMWPCNTFKDINCPFHVPGWLSRQGLAILLQMIPLIGNQTDSWLVMINAAWQWSEFQAMWRSWPRQSTWASAWWTSVITPLTCSELLSPLFINNSDLTSRSLLLA